MVSFKTSTEDFRLIEQIVDRAHARALKAGHDAKKHTLLMDVTTCHANGCPLRLADLLAADDFNLIHDVFGIARHIDRSTGRLGDCFVPRFAVKVEG